MKRYTALSMLLLLASCKEVPKQPAAKAVVKDTIEHGYNELQGTKGKSALTVSDYNTDNPQTQIERPAKSTVNTTLDTGLLYNIWTTDPDGPTADFEISAKSFYVADYDGDGDMPYTLKGNKLTVYYNDFTATGEIAFLSKDTLKIKWDNIDAETTYVLFPQD